MIINCFENFDANLEIKNIILRIQELSDTKSPLINADELESFENEIQGLCNHLQGIVIGNRIQSTLRSEAFEEEEKAFIKSGKKKMTSNGYNEINVTSRCGVTVRIESRVFHGKGRLKKGRIVRPGLILLGIHEGYTPALTSEVSKMVAALTSMEETRILLKERGIIMGVNTIRNIAYQWARRARISQHMDSIDFGETVKGRVVACGIDGGRIRIRKDKRGPKTLKNRSHYHTHWREPKLLIIYIVGEDGKRDRSVCPIIDGTMKGPNAIFKLTKYYLEKIGITAADNFVFVSDGAQWIWDRVQGLVAALGLKSTQVVLTLDFYHAVEHLGKVANLCSGKWNKQQQKRWINRYRNSLLKGKVDKVIEEIKLLCKGRKSRKIRTEMNYFIKHRKHMNYAAGLSLGLPIGSGAVESAVRRVINLRIKGPGIFWKRENAEMMLLLRGYYKSGRWDLLKKMSLSTSSVIQECQLF